MLPPVGTPLANRRATPHFAYQYTIFRSPCKAKPAHRRPRDRTQDTGTERAIFAHHSARGGAGAQTQRKGAGEISCALIV